MANVMAADANHDQMWAERPYEEATKTRAWSGSPSTHAYVDEKLRQLRMTSQLPVLQPLVLNPATVYRELPLDSAGHGRNRCGSVVHINGSHSEGSSSGSDCSGQVY